MGEGPGGETGVVTARPEAWGDVILARKETPTSYHLSVVIDDALQGVTDVVRGRDLFWSTSVHLLLQQLLGIPQPVYRHHRLIEDASGHKLSKSTQATGLARIARGKVSRLRIFAASSDCPTTPVVLLGVVENVSVTSAAVACHAGCGRGRGTMAAKRRSRRTTRPVKKRPAKEARIQRRGERARCPQIRRHRLRHGRDRAGGLRA